MVHGDLVVDGEGGTRKGCPELVEIVAQTTQGTPLEWRVARIEDDRDHLADAAHLA